MFLTLLPTFQENTTFPKLKAHFSSDSLKRSPEIKLLFLSPIFFSLIQKKWLSHTILAYTFQTVSPCVSSHSSCALQVRPCPKCLCFQRQGHCEDSPKFHRVTNNKRIVEILEFRMDNSFSKEQYSRSFQMEHPLDYYLLHDCGIAFPHFKMETKRNQDELNLWDCVGSHWRDE